MGIIIGKVGRHESVVDESNRTVDREPWYVDGEKQKQNLTSLHAQVDPCLCN